jgi:broad specificity phosphatase PhoE
VPRLWWHRAAESASEEENRKQWMQERYIEPFAECCTKVEKVLAFARQRPERRIAVFGHGDHLQLLTGSIFLNGQVRQVSA